MFRVIKERQLNFIKSISPQPTLSPEVEEYVFPERVIPGLLAASGWFQAELKNHLNNLRFRRESLFDDNGPLSMNEFLFLFNISYPISASFQLR